MFLIPLWNPVFLTPLWTATLVYFFSSREEVEPNASTLSDMEALDIASVVAIAPDPGNNPDPLGVLAAVADDDRNSSGGEEEDISERIYRS